MMDLPEKRDTTATCEVEDKALPGEKSVEEFSGEDDERTLGERQPKASEDLATVKRGRGRPPNTDRAAPPAQSHQDLPPGVVERIRVHNPREAAEKGESPYEEDEYFKSLFPPLK